MLPSLNSQPLVIFCLGILLLLGMVPASAVAEDIMVQSQPESPSPQPETQTPAAAEVQPQTPLPDGAPAHMETKAMAVLQALDKVTGRVHVLNVVVDQPARFASLTLRVRSCRKSLPEDSPESAAFLEIQDTNPKGEKSTVFSGWMFASSPAVSAMEHPMFDVWVVECRN
jgi:hypothetical protein